jgi:acyl-CoA dehydrogenase
MDFGFTDEQDEIRGLAKRILEDKVVEERLREVEAGVDRFDREVFKALADAGLLGIGISESAGGGGYGLIEQCLVLEQVGRTVAPVPVLATTVLGAAPIAEFGTPEQIAAHVVPAIAGEKILTAALIERLNTDPTKPTTTAVKDGDGWVLTGTKVCVPAGPLADLMLVPATVTTKDHDDGVGVFLVHPEGPGVTMTRQATTNKDAESMLEMDGAPAVDLLGTIGNGEHITQWILERGTVGLCAQQLGVVGKALEMTSEYSKTRVQFERPIATFQAVGQRMADGYIDVEGVRLTTWQAAWRLSEGLPAATEVEVAKFWAAEAGHRIAHTAVHIHGGMGVDVDYPLHRYFIAAKQIEFTMGGATEQLLAIGRTLATEPA